MRSAGTAEQILLMLQMLLAIPEPHRESGISLPADHKPLAARIPARGNPLSTLDRAIAALRREQAAGAETETGT